MSAYKQHAHAQRTHHVRDPGRCYCTAVDHRHRLGAATRATPGSARAQRGTELPVTARGTSTTRCRQPRQPAADDQHALAGIAVRASPNAWH